MNSWVLIIAMFSPSGDFISKQHEYVASQTACQTRLKQVVDTPSVLQVRVHGLCVTRAHWEGKQQMKNVAYD